MFGDLEVIAAFDAGNGGVTAIKVNTVIERTIVESSFERMAKSPEQGLADAHEAAAAADKDKGANWRPPC